MVSGFTRLCRAMVQVRVFLFVSFHQIVYQAGGEGGTHMPVSRVESQRLVGESQRGECGGVTARV